ncbi:GNAT family N-acetyltransferase [Sedimentibacter sp. MB31-C6]|uniref:GNAT family N-acetyltransferase n=1 Tax=Sedimentibacter sp. MB31-C6 TaxID=3109366 RepID=UPI002DDCFB5D|nr:GNAT family protein [Sedimentibacter sp. MB36-C1]WSI03557.1 GNAT family protein [Sedimentibacter sp. MB36-C1]
MEIMIRKFQEEDIPYKVKWINDEENNKFLHYDLPLRKDKTLLWFNSIKDRKDRADYTIILNDEPAGLIGLLNIDNKNRKAEYYITLGTAKYKGKGVATIASDLLIKESFNIYKLNKIYLYTEVENLHAQKLFERIGFIKEGLLKEDLIQEGRKIDRFLYVLFIEEYLNKVN